MLDTWYTDSWVSIIKAHIPHMHPMINSVLEEHMKGKMFGTKDCPTEKLHTRGNRQAEERMALIVTQH